MVDGKIRQNLAKLGELRRVAENGRGVASIPGVRGDRVCEAACVSNGRWSTDREWIATLIRETEAQLARAEEERRQLLQQLQALNGMRR